MARYAATAKSVLRVSTRTQRTIIETNQLERLVTGRTAGQLAGVLYSQRRETLLRLAKRRGIDVESLLKPRVKPPQAMPPITRIDPNV